MIQRRQKKTCTSCKQSKDLSEFSKPYSRKARNGNMYQHPWCSECLRVKASERYQGRTPEQNIQYRAVALGLDSDEVLAAFAEWDGRCEICREILPPPGKKGMHLDHDHVSKKFRGFLCAQCNMALGLFKDRADLLLAGAAYLDLFRPSKRY